jgi:hypothetical protein
MKQAKLLFLLIVALAFASCRPTALSLHMACGDLGTGPCFDINWITGSVLVIIYCN